LIPTQPNTPVPGLGVEGYTSELVTHPGRCVDVMLGGEGAARLEVVRLIHGDPSPDGPGYKEEPVPWYDTHDLSLSPRDLDLGSFLRVPARDSLRIEGDFTFGTWIYPTLLNPGWNTIAARWGTEEISFGVFCAGKTLVGGISLDGENVEWVNAKEFVYLNRWQFVALSYEAAAGRAGLLQYFMSDHPRATPHDVVLSEQVLSPGAPFSGSADIFIGALPPVHEGQRGHWAHLNGKLSGMFLASEALTPADIEKIAHGSEPDAPLIARWDLSRDIATTRVVDVSGNENHGIVVNMAARGVTGVGYERRRRYTREGSFSRRSDDYDAVHLHEDDLDDAGWDISASIEVPDDASPGLYAAKVVNEREQLFLPFVVSRRRAESELVFLLPTFTWTAYTSNRSPYSYTRDGVLDRGNSLYHPHADGSPTYYVSRRRPTRTHTPVAGFEQRGAHKITSNLYLIDWLEQQGLDHEVIADDDLDERGVEALGDCRCLLLGSHPEYWSPTMVDAVTEYVRDGGRIAYMGAEFLLWIATRDPERFHIMEVRKSEGGDYHPPLMRPRGESEHSTVALLGGAWSERGRHARNLFGVEVTAQGWFDVSLSRGTVGFERTKGASDERYSWILEGVDEDPIGAYGLNAGSAAWLEMDGALPTDWIPGVERHVIARAGGDEFWSSRPEPPIADIALTTFSNGAAVFSAGSISWTGSLSHAGYDNGVSRITRNVINRFLETPKGGSVLLES
jgi:N,N-dimethylformamidase